MNEPKPSRAFFDSVRRAGVVLMLPSAQIAASDSSYWLRCIAEGLAAIGIPMSSNTPLPQLAGRIPIGTAVAPISDDAVLLADISGLQSAGPECQQLANQVMSHRQRRSALLCMSDVADQIDFPAGWPVFTAHCVARVRKQNKRIPWAFGLSTDVLDKIAKLPAVESRQRLYLRNFRPSENQDVRNALDLAFVKRLAQRVPVDSSFYGDGRWQSSYFERLAGSLGCLAYGGAFEIDHTRHLAPGPRRIDGDDPVVCRWDSWRFWESMATGCVTVGLDIDEYGLQLPVTPQNGVHYVGLRFDRLEEAVDLLAGPPEPLQEIARQGRKWALQNYSPAPVAMRLLAAIEDLEVERDSRESQPA